MNRNILIEERRVYLEDKRLIAQISNLSIPIAESAKAHLAHLRQKDKKYSSMICSNFPEIHE
jgi:hypothetical protein